MTFLELKKLASSKGMEIFQDKDGDYCLRPMHFRCGIRQIRMMPDNSEYNKSLLQVLAILNK